MAGCLVSLAGCVTESITPVRPVGPVAMPGTQNPRQAPGRPAVVSGPSISGSLSVSLQSLGSLEYDGQTLPLASPDGMHMVVQVGRAAPWPALLAAPDAAPALGTRFRRYDLAARRAVPVDGADAPAGLLLGRSADAEGFLVEWPRPDGSRWIGLAPWDGGPVLWLVEGEAVNAFAIRPEPDCLVYSRRAVDQLTFELVELRAGVERILASAPDASFVYPAVSPDRATLAAVKLTEKGCELAVFRASSDKSEPADLLPLGVPAAMSAAHEVFAAAAACPPRFQSSQAPGAAALARTIELFLPGDRQAALYDPLSARIHIIKPASVCAPRWITAAHAVVVAPGARDTRLFDVLQSDSGAASLVARAAVANRPLLIRGGQFSAEGLIAIGPTPQETDPPALEIVRIVLWDRSQSPPVGIGKGNP